MAKSDSYVFLSPTGDDNKGPANVYLWGFQPDFLCIIRNVARQLFSKLDPEISPDVFLVAINSEENSKLPKAVVEPPDHEFNATDFERILQLAAELENTTGKVSYGYSSNDQKAGEAWIKRELRRDFRRNVYRAVQRTIEGACPHDKQSVFLSSAREIGPYFIYTVLMISTSHFDSHPRLRITERDRYSIVTSLLDASASAFLSACSEVILSSIAGDSFARMPDVNTILRCAGELFMYTPTGACSEFNGLHGGFATCNEISSLTYEKGAGCGRLLLARTGHDCISETISFIDPPHLNNYRAVRKLLELASDKEALISNSDVVTGLGRIVGNYDASKENMFEIEFVGHAKWQLVHGGIVLMRVEHGIPQLPQQNKQLFRFMETFERLFSKPNTRQKRATKGIVRAVTNLQHGAIVIVAENAEQEAKRFGNQATSIEPVVLTDELIKKASRIDGAMLVSPYGICYAIGVILDGVANQNGNSSRGSRYNSTVRYVQSSMCACVGLVVSDDGMIDIVPAYRPRISRAELNRRMELLEKAFTVEESTSEQSEATSDGFDEKAFCDSFEWLRIHSFYLSSTQCERINAMITMYQARPLGTGFRRIYSEIAPSSDMNDSFFID